MKIGNVRKIETREKLKSRNSVYKSLRNVRTYDVCCHNIRHIQESHHNSNQLIPGYINWVNYFYCNSL